MLPNAFDLRQQPHAIACAGFKPLIHQGACGACVAASLATILSIQACMGLKRRPNNITYSAQRIWDCYGGSCALGVQSPLISTFFPYVLQQQQQQGMLITSLPPSNYYWASRPNAETPELITDSNTSRCLPPQVPPVSSLQPPKLLGVQSHRNLGHDPTTTTNNNNNNNNTARHELKAHILSTKRPVMAIARMTASTFENFILPFSQAQLQAQAAFSLGTPGHVLHALTVLGWRDTDGAWLVQNSMGPRWQANGIGWVLGPIEAEWYSFDLEDEEEEADSTAAAADAAGTAAKEEDMSFLILKRPSSAAKAVVVVDPDHQIDVIVFLLTCMSIGCLAWLLCFCLR